MKPVLYVLSGFAVMALAVWAYSENYRTQAALARVDVLQGQIAVHRRTLAVLRAEWAYLNRPARLNDLAAMNFDRLQLLPLAPEQFVTTDEIGYPLPPPIELDLIEAALPQQEP